jgi:hypothetical protein
MIPARPSRFPLCGAEHTATGIRTPGPFLLETAAKGIPLYRPNGTIRAFTVVDAEDFERFGTFRWCVRETHHLYVVRMVRNSGRSQRLYLHRELMGLRPGDPLRVDHINRDTLDNRRSNLRICTDAENAQNQTGRPGSLSKYRGVTWRNDRNRWRAAHWLNHKLHYIGTFEDEDEAGRAAAAWRAEHMPFSDEARAS